MKRTLDLIIVDPNHAQELRFTLEVQTADDATHSLMSDRDNPNVFGHAITSAALAFRDGLKGVTR